MQILYERPYSTYVGILQTVAKIFILSVCNMCMACTICDVKNVLLSIAQKYSWTCVVCSRNPPCIVSIA